MFRILNTFLQPYAVLGYQRNRKAEQMFNPLNTLPQSRKYSPLVCKFLDIVTGFSRAGSGAARRCSYVLAQVGLKKRRSPSNWPPNCPTLSAADSDSISGGERDQVNHGICDDETESVIGTAAFRESHGSGQLGSGGFRCGARSARGFPRFSCPATRRPNPPATRPSGAPRFCLG